ncbi:MAG: hypothetical protein GWN82_03705, partial [Gemmatimonadetes bacterium]|nr:hypothetical protein [Gemmatimonadota bacterium]NIU29853.1 hypothetical protein [Gemmatimonadota bacterium]NIV60541.1 hypothetical protein [Gemmatimonadota bacterium]NIW62923.1 hypothetical protein [Gemmatimonadota bacterium]
ENYPLSPLRLHGVDVEEISGDGGGSFNDHTVVLFDTDPSYKGYVAYNRSLFDEATVRRTAESLLEYLSFGIRHP